MSGCKEAGFGWGSSAPETPLPPAATERGAIKGTSVKAGDPWEGDRAHAPVWARARGDWVGLRWLSIIFFFGGGGSAYVSPGGATALPGEGRGGGPIPV